MGSLHSSPVTCTEELSHLRPAITRAAPERGNLPGDRRNGPETATLTRSLRLLLLFATPLWTLWRIRAYGVDVPYWDQWEGTFPLFQKFYAGTLGLGDFLHFHNEHRILVPRLAFLCLGLATRWNIRAEMFATWLLAGLCVANLWRLGRATGFSKSRLGPWLPVGLTFLIFSPVQQETWLNGFQVSFLIPVVLLTTILWLPLILRPKAGFIWTMVLATLTTFSVASGFLVWIIATPLLWLRTQGEGRRYNTWWAIWTAVFLLNLVLYLHGYQKPDQHPNPFLFLQEPLGAFAYLMAYLGAGFASNAAVASVTGALLLLSYLGCIISLWNHRSDRQLLARALPWVVLPVFAFGNAFLTMIGRLGFGVDEALSTRYIIFSVMLPVSLLFLVPCLLIEPAEQRVFGMTRPVRTGAAALFALVLACMQLVTSENSLQSWFDTQRARLNGKAALAYIDVLPNFPVLQKLSYEDIPLLKQDADTLDRLDYLRPKLIKSAAIREVADPASPGDSRYGKFIRSSRLGSNVWLVAGSAMLPDSVRPADAVLFTFDNSRDEPVVFAFATMGLALDAVGGSS